MKLFILGATGATGQLLVDQAIGRGHEVVAYVRQPSGISAKPGLTIVGGQLDDQPAFQAALKGADAVLCCLGTHSLVGVDLMQRSLPLVAQAMQETGVVRLVLLSAYGVGETARSASLLARIIYKTLVSSVYGDKEKSEAALARTGLKWTGIYPVILTNEPPSEVVDVRPLASVTKVAGMPKVSRANVARAMLDAVENDGTVGQAIVVSAKGSVR